MKAGLHGVQEGGPVTGRSGGGGYRWAENVSMRGIQPSSSNALPAMSLNTKYRADPNGANLTGSWDFREGRPPANAHPLCSEKGRRLPTPAMVEKEVITAIETLPNQPKVSAIRADPVPPDPVPPRAVP